MLHMRSGPIDPPHITVLRSDAHTARTTIQGRCARCTGRIHAGQRYNKTVLIDDGEFRCIYVHASHRCTQRYWGITRAEVIGHLREFDDMERIPFARYEAAREMIEALEPHDANAHLDTRLRALYDRVEGIHPLIDFPIQIATGKPFPEDQEDFDRLIEQALSDSCFD